MSTLAQELKSKLAGLSKEDRLELTFFLLDQMQDDDPAWLDAWTEELHRRENDPKYVPTDEVFAKYRKTAP